MFEGIYAFKVPPVILYGISCTERVGEYARKLGSERSLLVTDKVMERLGYVDKVKETLERSGVRVEIFDDVPKEPEMEFVEGGKQLYNEANCNSVVAVGGGSVIDTAKGIATLATNRGSIRDFEGLDKIPNPKAPLIAIPTTAGTGSEVTRFMIVTDVGRNRKMLIGSDNIIPDVAVVDPLLTLSMPQSLTMATGIDALTHAIEAYISVKAQPMTDTLALKAIELISKHLRHAWANGEDINHRERVMLGSLLAGIAFSNSSVALVHGMSRPLGVYFHLPHGLSNAVLLSTVMEFSSRGDPVKFADIAAAMGERIEDLSVIGGAERAVEAVRRLCIDLDVPTLRGLGVRGEDLINLAPRMAEDALVSGSPANNPRRATKEEIVELYKKLII